MSGIVVSSTPDDDGTTQFEVWEEITSSMRDKALMSTGSNLTHHDTRFVDDHEYGRVGARVYGPVWDTNDRMSRYQRRQDEYDEAYAIIRDHVSYIDGIDPTCDKGRMTVQTADIP